MSDLAKSFFSLVKYNNGAFKSEKQATFLLSVCEGNIFTTVQSYSFGEHGGARAQKEFRFFCNDKGIYKVETIARKSGKHVIHWERKTQQELDAIEKRDNERMEKEAASAARYNRVNKVADSIAERAIAMDKKIVKLVLESSASLEERPETYAKILVCSVLSEKYKKRCNQVLDTINLVRTEF